MTTYLETLELERIAEEIADNTDRNYHTENAIFIAEKFGDEHDKVVAKYIKDQHDKRGGLHPAEFIIRTRLIDNILAKQPAIVEKTIREGL